MLTVAISLLGLESKLRLRQVNGDFGDRHKVVATIGIFCESIFCSSAKSSYRTIGQNILLTSSHCKFI